MPVTLREATPTDAAELAALNVSTWREAYSHLLPDDFFSAEFVDSRRRMWTYLLDHPRDDRRILVAEADGSLIGFAWVGEADRPEPSAEPPRDRQIFALYVTAEYYGTGAGQALLDAALEGSPALLWVAKQNPRAIAFYLRNGFAFDGLEQDDPVARITDARMVR